MSTARALCHRLAAASHGAAPWRREAYLRAAERVGPWRVHAGWDIAGGKSWTVAAVAARDFGRSSIEATLELERFDRLAQHYLCTFFAGNAVRPLPWPRLRPVTE